MNSDLTSRSLSQRRAEAARAAAAEAAEEAEEEEDAAVAEEDDASRTGVVFALLPFCDGICSESAAVDFDGVDLAGPTNDALGGVDLSLSSVHELTRLM